MDGRTLVIGDIHGALKALEQVLERANVSTNDTLIFLGDYVDGWSDAANVINYLIQLKTTHNCIFIKGNHDELILKWLTKQHHNPQWLIHGGQTTVDAYSNIEKGVIDVHIHFLENLENYHIDSENRLYVHAGFTNERGVKEEAFPKMFYWDRTLWEMVLAMDKNLKKESELYPRRLLNYKEIYIGHTCLTRIGKSIPHNAANVWNIDTGAAYDKPLTIFDVDTKQYWQSDPANELYPLEKGRN